MAEAIPLWARVKLAVAVALLLSTFFVVAARVAARSHAEVQAPASLKATE